ncbi:MAG: dihydrolipoamide succinyltransferase [Acidobacteria bacterium]|nr:MAG: dihydrolipoamide succinyltransferase [Acidobacteriota bacterium]RLE25603.1 MAG: dihydrolipoamide succinyltransferase [Acidobacteriota bacterium]
MSIVDIKIPQVGESISEGVLVEWVVADGDIARIDEPLLILETDKITMTVAAEATGRLKTITLPDEVVLIDQVVGTIDTSAVTDAPQVAAIVAPDAETPAEPAAALEGLSPAVRRLVAEHGLDPSLIEGSGKDGRILKGDVLVFMERGAAPAQETPVPAPAAPKKSPVVPPGERQTRTPMSRLRHRLAERLVEVQQTTAMLTTFNEADMSRVIALRTQYKEGFKEKHGVGLGFMSFFLKATVEALKAVPDVNAWVDGDDIVQNHYYDIGVAVSSEKGLVVPVVRDADTLSFAGVESEIKRLAQSAQDRTLELSDLSGGVFTISNGGIFESLMSTPILNPPQSAILGMHAIKKRPIAIGDEVVVRPMMYLAVSYDHRIVDGKEAVTFLKRIVDCIENPERLMLEV